MIEPTLRRATAADADALSVLMVRTFRETYRSDRGGNLRPDDVEAYIAITFGPERQAAEIANGAIATIVAESEGALAAYAQVKFASAVAAAPGPDPVELSRFYVDRPWHGRGLAARLMREVVAIAGEADPLWLCVYNQNHRAQAFYAKMGWRHVGHQPFTMGDDIQDDWVLVHAPAGL